MISKVLMNTGATIWSSGMMYKAVEHTVLLYESESWVVTR